MTPLFAVFAAVTLICALDVMRFGLPVEGARLAVLLIPAGGGLLTLFAMIWLATSRARLARPRERTCEACKGIVPAEPPGASICPNCRNKELSPGQVQKEQGKAMKLIIFIVVIVAIFGMFTLAMSVRAVVRFGRPEALRGHSRVAGGMRLPGLEADQVLASVQENTGALQRRSHSGQSSRVCGRRGHGRVHWSERHLVLRSRGPNTRVTGGKRGCARPLRDPTW